MSILGRETLLAVLKVILFPLLIFCCLDLPWRHIVRIITNRLVFLLFLILIDMQTLTTNFSAFPAITANKKHCRIFLFFSH